MHSTGVAAVNATTAHREWATRPPDERFASVSALYEAARLRRDRTEERVIETRQFRTEAPTPDGLVLREPSGLTAGLTHWSFEQLAAIAGAPPKYLRTLPADLASSAINHGLRRHHRDEHVLYDLMAERPAWQLPLGYKDGVYGAEKVPSGAYLGDRDMFLFMVDGNRDLDDPTDASHAGLFRGFILRNSDVGAAALTLDVFLYRMICGNNIIWGFQHVAGFRRRHVGASIQDEWTASLTAVRSTLDADVADDRLVLLRAQSRELGSDRAAVIETAVQRLDLSQKQAGEAYALAETFESNPRSVWGYVQGLTRLSQRTPWQDGRFALDRAASRLLTTVH